MQPSIMVFSLDLLISGSTLPLANLRFASSTVEAVIKKFGKTFLMDFFFYESFFQTFLWTSFFTNFQTFVKTNLMEYSRQAQLLHTWLLMIRKALLLISLFAIIISVVIWICAGPAFLPMQSNVSLGVPKLCPKTPPPPPPFSPQRCYVHASVTITITRVILAMNGCVLYTSSSAMILICSTMPICVKRPAAAAAALWLINAALSKHLQHVLSHVLSQSCNSLYAQGKDSAWPLKMVWCWPGTCKGRAFPNKPCASASFFSTNASCSSYGACIHQLLKQAESCLDRLQAPRSTVQG